MTKSAKEEAEEEDQAFDVEIGTKGDRRNEIIIYILTFMFIIVSTDPKLG